MRRSIVKNTLLRVTALLLLAPACAPLGMGSYVAPVAAVVNGENIPASEVSAELRRLTLDPGREKVFDGREGEANAAQAQREVLSQLIQQWVALQEARRLGITAEPEEVEIRFEQARAQEGFEDFLRQWRVDEDAVRELLARQLILEKAREAITADVDLTDDEAEEVYADQKDRYDGQRRLAHILICSEDQIDPERGECRENEEDTRTANTVAERANGGEDFAALAREFSRDPQSRERGGDLGWISPGQFEGIGLTQLEEVAFDDELAEGGIAGPVWTPLGAHVIRVVDMGRPRAEALEEIIAEGSQPKKEQAFEDWILDQLSDAEIQVNPRFGRFERESFRVVPHGVRLQDTQE